MLMGLGVKKRRLCIAPTSMSSNYLLTQRGFQKKRKEGVNYYYLEDSGRGGVGSKRGKGGVRAFEVNYTNDFFIQLAS